MIKSAPQDILHLQIKARIEKNIVVIIIIIIFGLIQRGFVDICIGILRVQLQHTVWANE